MPRREGLASSRRTGSRGTLSPIRPIRLVSSPAGGRQRDTVDTHVPETHHSTFAKSPCTERFHLQSFSQSILSAV